MSAFTIESAHPVRVEATDEEPITLLNKGDSFYYGQTNAVSSSNKDGTVTNGQSLTLTIPTWIRSASSSYIQMISSGPPDPLTAASLVTLTPSTSGRNTVQPASGVNPITFLLGQAVTSNQNPAFVTPAGSGSLSLDKEGHFTVGPNEIYNRVPGSDNEIADLAYNALTRRVIIRRLDLGDVNDPPDLQLGRAGSAYTRAAEALTLPNAGPLYVAYAGPAFTSSGTLTVGSISFTYSAHSNQATTTTTGGAQTVNRDSIVTLNVASTTNFLTPSGSSYARAGEEYISYTGIGSSTTLTGVSLVASDARTSVSIANGATVSQDKFTGLSGGSGSISRGDSVEQNTYPVPSSLSVNDVPGLNGRGEEVGHLQWKGWITQHGFPGGSKGGGRWGAVSAYIGGIVVEPPRGDAAGGALLFKTTPLGGITEQGRMEVMHDGSVRIGPNSKIGSNAITTAALARLSVEGETASLPVYLGKGASSQSGPYLKFQDSSDAAKFQITSAGGLGIGNSAAGSTPGTVVKKAQIFDASGSSLGYLPIYDAIS